MRVYLFRLSLSERGRPDLFDQDYDRPTRTAFLREHLSRQRDFAGHGGVRLRYGFAQSDREVFSGVIGKWVTEKKEADPSNLWATTDQNHWEKAAIFFNLDPHEQVVGLEHKRSVGVPSTLIKHLITDINENSGRLGYKIDAFPVGSELEFREAIANYPAPITQLSFDLVTPNPSDAAGATARALKKLRKRWNADRYKGQASNKDGLNAQDPLVSDVAEYASKGGGDMVAKSDKVTVYDSRDHVASAEIPEDARPTGEDVEGLGGMVEDKLKR